MSYGMVLLFGCTLGEAGKRIYKTVRAEISAVLMT